MLIKEQMRKYKVKMEEITQLEAAESIAFRRLSLLRQNAVSNAGWDFGGGGATEVGVGTGGRGLDIGRGLTYPSSTLSQHTLGHRQPDLGPRGSMFRG